MSEFPCDGEEALFNNGSRVVEAQDNFDKHIEAVKQEFRSKDEIISRQRALISFLLIFVIMLMGMLIYITT